MRCINFDKEFERYISAWMKEHAKEYKNDDEMEAAMPDVYEEFLDTPVNWLGGAKPGEYFSQFDNAHQLVNWMEDYFKQRIPVPDMLLNRIVSLGEPAEKRLFALLQKERTPQEARMTAVSLLGEMESTLPMQLYIGWQLDREAEDELCDAACESLAGMGEAAVAPMLAALESANDAGKEALCGVLSHYPDTTGKVLPELLRLIRKPDANIAVLAGYLGRLGEEGALETLIDLALEDDLSYLNYIELRSAIERLGGDAPERAFDENDPEYEAMSRLQMSWGKEEPGQAANDLPLDGDYLQ